MVFGPRGGASPPPPPPPGYECQLFTGPGWVRPLIRNKTQTAVIVNSFIRINTHEGMDACRNHTPSTILPKLYAALYPLFLFRTIFPSTTNIIYRYYTRDCRGYPLSFKVPTFFLANWRQMLDHVPLTSHTHGSGT